jgi:hypothetical protein
MAITFVGSAERSTTTASANYAIDLTGLGLQQGDLVIVATGFTSTSNLNAGVTSSGWTEVCDLYSDDSRDSNLAVCYKVMGSTPDTSVTCIASTAGGNSSCSVVQAFRGVDTTTPLDATTTTATGINTGVPNSPSITPTTSGAWVVVAGGGSSVGVDNAVTAPSGYSNQADISADGGNAFTVGMASKAWTSGAEDPAVWTNWTDDGATESFCAATLALRPAAAVGQPAAIRSANIPHAVTGCVGSLRGGRW